MSSRDNPHENQTSPTVGSVAQWPLIQRLVFRFLFGYVVLHIVSGLGALARDRELAELLRDERDWLLRFEQTVAEVRRFRDMESRRFWPGVVWRWLLAFSFALLAAWAAGAGYTWASQPHTREMESLRQRAELFDRIAERVTSMTPAQRRQLEALLDGRAGRPR